MDYGGARGIMTRRRPLASCGSIRLLSGGSEVQAILSMQRWFSLRRRAAAAKPRIVLHVGRSKAGSTTIQDFCRDAHPHLAAHGVDYVMFGHLKDAEPGIPGFGTFEELAAFAAASSGRTVLVSNEFMFAWPVEFTRSGAAALRGCNVRIVIYLRPYDGWVQSAYTEETRHGRNVRAIDGFMEGYPLRTSAWEYLEGWGESFGWDRLHLGSLAPGGLNGDDLITDFAQALGVPPPGRPAPRRNTAPHQAVLELARRLAAGNSEVDWQGVDRAAADALIAAMTEAAAGRPQTPYFAVAQRRELVDLYNADLDRIARHGGPRLPPAPPPNGPEREFEPSFDRLAPEIRDAFFAETLSPAFADRHPAAASRARELAAGSGHLK